MVNITYTTPPSHDWQSANNAGLASKGEGASLPQAPAVVQTGSTCAACGGPLTKRWQKRACSTRCAGKLTPIRAQDGANNDNYKGGISAQRFRYARYSREFYAARPEVLKAQRAAARAIRQGVLVRPSACSKCGVGCRPDAHHPNYAKPLKVEWLCRKCHCAANSPRRDRVNRHQVHGRQSGSAVSGKSSELTSQQETSR